MKKGAYRFFSYTLPYIENTLSTFECSLGYGLATKVGIVSQISSRPQLDLYEISS